MFERLLFCEKHFEHALNLHFLVVKLPQRVGRADPTACIKCKLACFFQYLDHFKDFQLLKELIFFCHNMQFTPKKLRTNPVFQWHIHAKENQTFRIKSDLKIT